jgi:hypothetical protein
MFTLLSYVIAAPAFVVEHTTTSDNESSNAIRFVLKSVTVKSTFESVAEPVPLLTTFAQTTACPLVSYSSQTSSTDKSG